MDSNETSIVVSIITAISGIVIALINRQRSNDNKTTGVGSGKKVTYIIAASLLIIAALIFVGGKIFSSQDSQIKTNGEFADTGISKDTATTSPDKQVAEKQTSVSYKLEYEEQEIRFFDAAHKIIMQIRKTTVEPLNQDEFILKFSIRCKNTTRGDFYFGNEYFRLNIDDLMTSPTSDLNTVVNGISDKDGEVEFRVPKNSKELIFFIMYGEEKYKIPLKLVPKKG